MLLTYTTTVNNYEMPGIENKGDKYIYIMICWLVVTTCGDNEKEMEIWSPFFIYAINFAMHDRKC